MVFLSTTEKHEATGKTETESVDAHCNLIGSECFILSGEEQELKLQKIVKEKGDF